MGIRGAIQFLSANGDSQMIKLRNITAFKYLTVAIDASMMMYHCILSVRNSGTDIVNKEGEITSHLRGIFYKVLMFLRLHITPIFVFDGHCPEMKRKIVQRRKNHKEAAEKKLEECTTQQDYVKHFKNSFSMTREQTNSLITLLQLMGIPYIIAPEEADVMLAWLTVKKDKYGNPYAHGVCTNDTDILALGAPYIFRNMIGAKESESNIQVISRQKVLEVMKLSQDQFIGMCALASADYSNRSITLEKAYDMVNTGSTPKDEEKQKQLETIKDYYENAVAKVTMTVRESYLEMTRCNSTALNHFMCDIHGFDAVQIKRAIHNLQSYHKQMCITKPNYFQS